MPLGTSWYGLTVHSNDHRLTTSMDFRACTQDVIRNLSPPETRVAVPRIGRTAALTRKRGGYLWIQIAIQIEAFSIRDSLTK